MLFKKNKKNKILSMRGILGKSSRTRTNEKVRMKTLKVGDKGEEVKHLQECINSLSKKYNTLPILVVDLYFGEKTKNAVEIFQNLSGITKTGVVDEQTWNKIHMLLETAPKKDPLSEEYNASLNVISLGSTGKYVVDLQRYLNMIANQYVVIDRLKVDGNFGAKTEASVMEFQKLFGLEIDGIVGDKTWNKIYDVAMKK